MVVVRGTDRDCGEELTGKGHTDSVGARSGCAGVLFMRGCGDEVGITESGTQEALMVRPKGSNHV